jgi:sugar-specific transcriptional regulator TrmB
MLACSSYCKRFNPVKYNQYLEGEIDKLFSYQKSLKTLIDKLKRRYEHDTRREAQYYKEEAEANNKAERQLSENKEVKTVTGRLDEDVNEINDFNKQFKTALIRPITYKFKEDLSVKYHINFDESLFAPGVEALYNLVDFKMKVNSRGINFHSYGDSSLIEKDTAMKIFEQMNPQNAKAEKEFDKMIAG